MLPFLFTNQIFHFTITGKKFWLIFLNVLAYLTSCCSANHLVHYMCRQIHIAHTVWPYIILHNNATILYSAFTLVKASISTLNRTKKSYNKFEDSRSKVYVYLKVCIWKGQLTNLNNLIKIRSFDPHLRSLLKNLTKSHTEVKSGDLSIMHDSNVMPRPKLSSDGLFRLVTEHGFC